eukprot:11227223-Lingulodinium_polyedra.AAC.1
MFVGGSSQVGRRLVGSWSEEVGRGWWPFPSGRSRFAIKQHSSSSATASKQRSSIHQTAIKQQSETL